MTKGNIVLYVQSERMIMEEIHKETEEKEKFIDETAAKIKELHHTFNQLVARSNIIRKGLEMIQEVDG